MAERGALDLDLLSLLAHLAAFWGALLLYAHRRPTAGLVRPALGLALGALLAHLGWASLHADVLQARPAAALVPWAGYTVLLVPAGPLLASLPSSSRPERGAFLAASLGTLPAAFAVARLGCVAVGCCHGVATSLPWGLHLVEGTGARHPVPLYEIAAYVALFAGLRCLPARAVPGAFLVAFGGIRLALEPLRASPPLGPTVVPVAFLAALWLAVGAASLYALRRGADPEPAGSGRPAAAR